MYVNWAHYYIPKVDGALSFIINPLFIYIIFNEKKLTLGNYKYLLLYFAIFNMTCSICDILVPTDVYDYGYAFANYISGGPFEEVYLEKRRCLFSFSSYNYSTRKQTKSFYRYDVASFLGLMRFSMPTFSIDICNNFLQRYFLPYGIIASILYLLFHISFWMVACGIYLKSDDERRLYIKESMKEVGLDPFKLNMLSALYQEGSDDTSTKSLIGMISITILSVLSVNALSMSEKTKRLQRYLMKALVVQATIPILVSFTPCVVSWYQPVFGVNLGSWSHHMATIAISVFPFLDPLAIICFVPSFRARLIEIFHFVIRKPKNEVRSVASLDENVVSQRTTEPRV